ncbi:MAG TPA: 2Fe-2S iron-sulfur cluster-binding protein [Polyangiaceae bacterium]|nr:2Fe-2S iron-sulfur cluster-binding protein [Polyangiaceae bacterium]
MPKVVFVNEHRIVEVPAGKNLKTLALELGIDPHREFFRGLNCGYWGVCGTCQVWVKESAPGAANAPNLRERMAGVKGLRRLACQVEVTGDVEITTFAGGDNRLKAPRPIAAPPRPTADATAKRKPIDAAGTAEFVYGHPAAVGEGNRVPGKKMATPDEEAADEDQPAEGS